MSIIVTEEDLCKKHVTKCALFCQYAILPPKQCPAAVQDTFQTKSKHHICAYNCNRRTGFRDRKKIWGSRVLSSALVYKSHLCWHLKIFILFIHCYYVLLSLCLIQLVWMIQVIFGGAVQEIKFEMSHLNSKCAYNGILSY